MLLFLFGVGVGALLMIVLSVWLHLSKQAAQRRPEPVRPEVLVERRVNAVSTGRLAKGSEAVQ